jgi:tetratricopeptide (TPR) repeat protein
MFRNVLLFFFLLGFGRLVFAQDTTQVIPLIIIPSMPPDSVFFQTYIINHSIVPQFNHSPDKEDLKTYRKYRKLINAAPDKVNHEHYFQLACALWQLEKLEESKNMFLTIIGSQKEYYSNTYRFSSDIPGDTTENLYGYGSSTYNYKNSACIYLARIFAEQKKFEQALKYLDDSEKKYPVHFTCGTGYHMHRNKIHGLYILCYEELSRYNDILDLLLPEYFGDFNSDLPRILKKMYSREEINSFLLKAEQSVFCKVDTSESYTLQEEGYEPIVIPAYVSEIVTIDFFNRTVILNRYTQEAGRKTEKEPLVNYFKQSYLYRELTKEDSYEE